MLPQRDLISWKSKASVFPLGNKSTCSQRLNPIPLLRSKGEEGDVIPTGLSTAFRTIHLQSPSTWEECGCVPVQMRAYMCVHTPLHLCFRGEVGGVRVAEGREELVWKVRSVPLELT